MATEVDRFLEAYPPDVRDLTNQARALVASVAPDATETLKIGWKVLWYGFGPRMAEQFAVVMPTKAHVGLGFSHGSELPDPSGRLEGVGKKIRHVKLRSSADVEDPAIAALLRAEIAIVRGGAGAAKPAARAKTAPASRVKTAAASRGKKGTAGRARSAAARRPRARPTKGRASSSTQSRRKARR